MFVDAARRQQDDPGVDLPQPGAGCKQLLRRQLVELQAVRPRPAQGQRVFHGIGLDDQFLLRSLRLDAGDHVQQRLRTAAERRVLLEYEHGLRQPEPVRRGASAQNGLHAQRLRTREALAG
ncbi:hypothetical protein D3C71_1708600 [compost metagenome]